MASQRPTCKLRHVALDLSRCPWIGEVPPVELDLLARAGRELSVPPATVLEREGRAGRESHLILDGRAEILARRRVVGHAGPGQLVGEVALLHGHPRSVTVRAATAMGLLTMSLVEWAGVLESAPRLRSALLGATPRA